MVATHIDGTRRSFRGARLALTTILRVGEPPKSHAGPMLVGLTRAQIDKLVCKLVACWITERYGLSCTSAGVNPAYDLARAAFFDRLASELGEGAFVAVIALGTDIGSDICHELEAVMHGGEMLHWISSGSTETYINPITGRVLTTFEAIPGAVALRATRAAARSSTPGTLSLAARYGFARAHCSPGHIIETFGCSASAAH